MSRLLRNVALATAAFAAATSWAHDDHFDPSKYDKGGFAAVADKAYAKECGSCHFAYLPGMLPARSWQALLQQKSHFGESLSLAPDVAQGIAGYLTANAADRSPYQGSRVILSRLPESATPLRVTQLPVMRQYHSMVAKLMASGAAPIKGGLSNCEACHTDASSGDFGLKKIHVPGVVSGASNGT
jgi:hypothetical protein